MNAPITFLNALFPIQADDPEGTGNDTHAAADAPGLVCDNRSLSNSFERRGGAGFNAGAFFAMHAAERQRAAAVGGGYENMGSPAVFPCAGGLTGTARDASLCVNGKYLVLHLRASAFLDLAGLGVELRYVCPGIKLTQRTAAAAGGYKRDKNDPRLYRVCNNG